MSALIAAHRLERLARHLRGEDLPPDERAEMADLLDAYLGGAVDDLNEALGLRPSPGARSWRTCAAVAQRDALIRACVARYFPGLPIVMQAEEMHWALACYATSGWVHERRMDVPAPQRAGTIQQECWHILKARDHVLAAERIRKILVAS